MSWIDRAFREASIARGMGKPVPAWVKWCIRLWWFFSYWPWQHIAHQWRRRQIRKLEHKVFPYYKDKLTQEER